MREKIRLVFDVIKRYDAKALISISPINRRWLFGTTSVDFCLLLFYQNKLHAFLDARDITTFSKKFPNVETHLYENINSWKDFNKRLKNEKVLFEGDQISYSEYMTFVKPINTKLVEISGNDLRIVKTESEIVKLQKAANIICKVMNHVKTWIKVGMSEITVAKEIEKYCKFLGASGLSFPSIVSFGDNSADIHGSPTERKLKRNEIILIDAGCVYEGFCSDITRIFCIGKLPKRLQKMYETVKHANLEGLKHIKVGMLGTEVDNVCRQFIKKQWQGYDYPHGTGHGVGMEIHENPRANKIYHKPILNNSVLTIEPGIYESGIGGVRIEDTIVVTNSGIKVLTKNCPK